jgi:hypothetical protein
MKPAICLVQNEIEESSMKCLPGLCLLLSMLLSPSLCWAEETAGGNGEATTEQAGGTSVQTTQGGSDESEEEPDCE